MNSGRENGAIGLSGRTDVIHTSRSGAWNGSARNKTALTTEKTAMFAPMARANVDTTANAKPGWRRNWRTATAKSFGTFKSPLDGLSRRGPGCRDKPRRRPYPSHAHLL